jgi:phage gpG-like protein
MPARIDISVAGDVQVSRNILRVGDRAGDMSPAFDQIADDIMEIEEEQFDSQGARGGAAWAPLKESTSARKRRLGLDPRILHATLDLRNSLTRRGDANQNLIIEPEYMVFGSDLPYIAPHQTGAPAVPLPVRRPINFTEQDRRGLVRTLQNFIMTGRVSF